MIKYISYYGNNECKEKRNYVLAATNKTDYIAKTILRHLPIKLVSASQSLDSPSLKYDIHTKDGVPVTLLATLGNGCKIRRVLDRAYIRVQLLKELLVHSDRTDTILLYHSLGYLKTIEFAKRIKKFRLIIEVEEVYADVIGNKSVRKKEFRFFRLADAYIFPTKLLNQMINVFNKPYTIIHGTYQVEPRRNVRFNDGKIHIVYAGTFDPRKGGAIAAAAAEFLDERYHIHIIGFGSEVDKRNLLEGINRINERSKCVVTYDGQKSGEEYIRFIQSCDIGLSTQNPDADFNSTSFPSKILSYMANGLHVVSVRIEAVERSDIGDLIYYYDEQTPEKIAEAILSVDLVKPIAMRKRIAELDAIFTNEIRELLEKLV